MFFFRLGQLSPPRLSASKHAEIVVLGSITGCSGVFSWLILMSARNNLAYMSQLSALVPLQLDGHLGQHRRRLHPVGRPHHHAAGAHRPGAAHLGRVAALRRRLAPVSAPLDRGESRGRGVSTPSHSP